MKAHTVLLLKVGAKRRRLDNQRFFPQKTGSSVEGQKRTNSQINYLITTAIKTRLIDFDLTQHIHPGASASHQSMTGVLDLVLQGRPLGCLPQITTSITRLAGASSSIRTTWPSLDSRWILICYTTSMS